MNLSMNDAKQDGGLAIGKLLSLALQGLHLFGVAQEALFVFVQVLDLKTQRRTPSRLALA